MVLEINKEEYKLLKEFDKALMKLANNKSTVIKSSSKERLSKLYQSITGIEVNCSGCSIDWLKRLGRAYKRFKDKNDNNTLLDNNTPPNELKINKPKRGRPFKNK